MKNIAGLMKQASEMQTKMQALQTRLESIDIEGVAGAGLVRCTLSGKGELRRLTIDPSVIDAAEAEMLADLIVAAHSDARRKSEAMTADEMQKLTGELGLPSGLKLPF